MRQYCEGIAREKKREFREWTYWGKPVPGFGDPKAKIWIVGLAPAAHGANRTGRMFTGDSSGDWLFRALHRAGFANQATSRSRDDGLELRDVYISATARCAPPDNKPLPEEIANCATYLHREWELLTERKLLLALGAIGFDAILKLLASRGVAIPKPKPRFAHDRLVAIEGHRILASYHPSRQNTSTGKLTEAMWEGIFARVRRLVESSEIGGR